MIKIIENALKDLAGMQLNLESDIARTWIAEKVEKAITDNRKAIANETADYILKDINCNTTIAVDDVITTAMENNGYTKGDSGYDINNGKRNIIFHTKNGSKFEVTFRRIWDT
jgi:hypothetical protein